MQGLPAVAAGLFRFLDEEGVEYCVLGDARSLPASIPGNLDLVVDKAARRILPELLKTFCDRSQLLLIERPTLPQEVSNYLVSWLGRERRPEFLSLCVRGDYLRSGRRLWSAAELLKDRVRAADLRQETCDIFVAPAAKEFVRHLLQCIDRNELSDRDGEHLSRQWRLDPEGAALQVARFWDAGREGGIILRAAAADHWEPVRASRNALHSALAFHNVPSPASWRSDVGRRLRCWTRPQGMLIACLGPDGAGKPEVIAALVAHPLAPFARAQTMHLRPHVMRPPRRERGPRPRKPRGRFGTTLKLMMFAADYWVGYWLRIRPSLVRATLLVSDSYFDDVLVDPRRYWMHRPRAFARLLAPWIPQPALWLVFDAPADVLRARQGDAPVEDLDRLRSEYRRVLRGRKNVVVLDARQPVEQVVADAERAIVSQAARRTARRLRLPLDAIDNPRSTRILLFFSRRSVPVLSRLVRVLFNSDIRCRIPSDIHLPHPYGIVIQAQTAIGRRATLMQQVTIAGKDPSETSAPIIGDDVYIGAGARVLGDVRIGDHVVIGANAVVTRDVPAGSTVVGANRIIAGRLALATKRAADGSVAHFPIGAHRAHR